MALRYIGIVFTLGGVSASAAGADTPPRQLLPATYEAGHFFFTPRLADGNALRLMVDTGGGGGSGLFVLASTAVKRLRLPTTACNVDGSDVQVVSTLPLHSPAELSAAPHTPCSAVALVTDQYSVIAHEDGVLGAGYLPHFIWTFDYPQQQLWRESTNWKPADDMHAAPLHFLKTKKGDKADGMPRIVVKVAGESISMLLDTGATAAPTEAGERATGIPTVDGIGVTSYITTRVLQRWHRRHPTWPVVDDADKLTHSRTRLIRVPQVSVAGWSIGPVWFTERSDANFIWMSGYMDAPVQGSVGANVWQHFRMTLDYPADTAWVACVTACQVGK